MKTSDFQFDLPEHLIAQAPLSDRSGSRMLVLDGPTGNVSHRQFLELEALVHPGDLLVFNDTRVIPARLFGQKQTGGRQMVIVKKTQKGSSINTSIT